MVGSPVPFLFHLVVKLMSLSILAALALAQNQTLLLTAGQTRLHGSAGSVHCLVMNTLLKSGKISLKMTSI
jgi:hypothetical protein